MQDLSYAWADLTAWHTDPIMDEGRHQHVWRITVYWPPKPFRDGRAIKAALVGLLAVWQGRDLPGGMWSQEDLGAAVLALLGTGDIVAVRVEREEGFGVFLWR